MDGANAGKRLTRPRQGRMIAGVCAGVGEYFGVDVNLVRVICAVLAVFTGGMFGVAYLVAWAVVPEEGAPMSPAEKYLGGGRA